MDVEKPSSLDASCCNVLVVKGVGAFCLNWAFGQCGHLRIDTHGDNAVMQNLVRKLGFVHCGTIYVEEDDDPRLAFEKTGN